MWNTACPDWERRILVGESLVPDLPLFEDEAAKALRIFKRLRVPDMHGTPKMGDVAGQWLFPIVEAIFGSYDPRENRRHIDEFFWLMPKKNGKTSSAAAIMVTALIINRRPEAEFVLVSTTKDVADIAFKQASGIIRADPELAKLFHIQGHYVRKITHRMTGASLQVKAADTDVITGGKQVGTLIDEEHVLASKANANELMIELRGAKAARPDGFLITITTQSKKPPQGIFKADLENARAVRDGLVKQPLLPILYELPAHIAKDNGWRDKAFWHVVNPNLGRSVNPQFLETELAKHEAQGPGELALFASQHFNVQIGQSLNADGWKGAEYWEACADPSLTLDALLDRSEVVTIGIDMGGTDDLFSVCMIGRERGDDDMHWRRWLVWQHSWCCEIAVERRKSESSRYNDFVQAGELSIVETEREQIEQAVELISRVFDAGLLGGIGADPWMMRALIDAVEVAGIRQPNGASFFEGVRQGASIGLIAQTVEWKLRDRSLVHAGQGIMSYAVGNMKVELKGNAPVIYKSTAGSAKIDPAMAMFDAAAVMGRNPEAVNQRIELFAV